MGLAIRGQPLTEEVQLWFGVSPCVKFVMKWHWDPLFSPQVLWLSSASFILPLLHIHSSRYIILSVVKQHVKHDGKSSELSSHGSGYENRTEPSGSLKHREFLDCLTNCQLLKNSAPYYQQSVVLQPNVSLGFPKDISAGFPHSWQLSTNSLLLVSLHSPTLYRSN